MGLQQLFWGAPACQASDPLARLLSVSPVHYDIAMLRDIIFVAVGGALGAALRYGVTLGATRLLGKQFPWGTLLVNVAGCFAIGVVIKVLLNLEASGGDVRPQIAFWQRAVAVGFLGGLTTFSTFSADTALALTGDRPGTAIANVLANVGLCLAATWCGMALLPAK